MSPHTTPTPASTVNADEIDLFELIQSLWQEKVLVVIMTAIFTVLALAYALLATPIYQTQATLVPPPAYAIQGYNEGRMEAFRNTGVKELTVGNVYGVFKTHLNSLQLRNRFFDEVYVPSLKGIAS
ncbi:Wzz/FepE/Etk N-terminal domain-containing protein [Denitrificimonas sp. JX-1]|uniref:Wzz/FepE/Etk N-terminal domain-containing protein n=1 Tax=Denitrificimonas halotolerans TaxID=3098930 RepID=A0ABU5GRY5_9GAMM|nr:Wzz/FepE/Etk N-terminal domain-containing protein [Denitrificimonas sp. JX-1]MDY7219629.1 Wzz/FepE/Etk N-terminal domain-containing protein [Denitrificimonas sp. JX-1]